MSVFLSSLYHLNTFFCFRSNLVSLDYHVPCCMRLFSCLVFILGIYSLDFRSNLGSFEYSLSKLSIKTWKVPQDATSRQTKVRLSVISRISHYFALNTVMRTYSSINRILKVLFILFLIVSKLFLCVIYIRKEIPYISHHPFIWHRECISML